ncbi:helix-turn-helix transcriptional regulator, partial [Dactylosporangium sp. NPDC051485]|uniref:helix-turn-helix transcriptional regulator n=1 Tax=Dactylosporangium sp. NPDC051485 TaxID=3154846 RepID=UPI00342DA637
WRHSAPPSPRTPPPRRATRPTPARPTWRHSAPPSPPAASATPTPPVRRATRPRCRCSTRSSCGSPGGHPAAAGALRRAARDAEARWLGVAAAGALDAWDDEGLADIAGRAVAQARAAGALRVLPEALGQRAVAHVLAGELADAAGLLAEADTIAAAGRRPHAGAVLLLAACRGRPVEAGEVIDAAVKEATARGEGRLLAAGEHARAVLQAGLGGYPAALAAGLAAAGHDDLGLLNLALEEVVEAACRTGAAQTAHEHLARLEERARAAGGDWALGVAARGRALVGTAPEDDFREAIARLDNGRLALPLARTRLLYGEWLRREQRRVDARAELRAAHEAFAAAGAEGFAERARRELAATGETARRRVPQTRDELTPQEAQIARLAAAGHTNPEIGAELFLSARTVEWHLRKVFGKLGVTSRRELRSRAG